MFTRTKDAEYDLPVRLGTLGTWEDKDTQEQVTSWADITPCRNVGVLWSSTEGHLLRFHLSGTGRKTSTWRHVCACVWGYACLH